MAKLFDISMLENGTESALDFITNILQASTEYSIIGKDLNGNILLWNEGATRIYGYQPEEMIGKVNAAVLHTPEDIAAGLPEEMRRIALNKGKWEGEINRVKKNGEHFRARAVITPRYDQNGKPIGFLLMSKDISEEVQLYEALEKSNKELEHFAFIISHDLQEPLRMIESYVQLLARRYKDKLDADANDFINFAVAGVERMQRLINDVLAFSRVATRAQPFASTDCNKVIKDTLQDLSILIEEKRAKVNTVHLPTILADETQIAQVFQNLISNALKFSEMHPTVHIAYTENAKEWIFSIKDNGMGINADQQEAIFILFHRLVTAKNIPGSGIGLATCKKIIERHHGKIWVCSEGEHTGSTFYFSIPKKDILK